MADGIDDERVRAEYEVGLLRSRPAGLELPRVDVEPTESRGTGPGTA
jgi:hypothetical protein